MGNYTALHFNAELKTDTPTSVIDTLKYMLGDTGEYPIVEDHKFFSATRWNHMLGCDSYYFPMQTHSILKWDETAKGWFLSINCNFKNYDSELELFIDWIMPYIKEDGGTREGFLGYSLYEYDKEPKLYYLPEEE